MHFVFRLKMLAAVLAALTLAGQISVAEAADLNADYEALRQARFSTQGTPIPAEGLELGADFAVWRLSSGSLYPMQPLADGTVTGFLFEGQGEFLMTIATPIEVRQLARFSEEDETETFSDSFTTMIIRTVRGLEGTLPEAAGSAFDERSVVKDRDEQWMRSFHDLNSRILAAARNPNDDYVAVDMDTSRHGWLAYQLEPFSVEPVGLAKLHERLDYVERWVSLERSGEGGATVPGRPGYERIDIDRVEIAVDLTEHDGREWDLRRSTEGDKVRFESELIFTPATSGAAALQFQLTPRAKVTAVRNADGAPLPFVRAHIGDMFTSVDKKYYDGSLLVALASPLEQGQERRLVFEYEMEIFNFVSGRSWYPGLPESLADLHHAKLTFTCGKGLEVRAIGAPSGTIKSGDDTISTWKTLRPTKMAGFAFGEEYVEEKMQLDNGPEVVVFGRKTGATTGNMVRNVAIDLAKSLHFYQWYFDTKLPIQKIYATRISSGHGQAFDGFIHLSHFTFNSESPGASELFRAHEAAHQYWGHLVGWKTYRDQWLSEAFAEYSAILFLEATLPDEDYVEEILDAYFDEQLGRMSSRMSKFARPGRMADMRHEDIRSRIGPIGVGMRASTARVPYGYTVQAYNKGALVVHMLRMMLKGAFGNDDVFRAVLKDFLQTYAGREATTADFIAVLSKHAPGDWSWFFDQWVFHNKVPTYLWDYSIPRRAAADGTYPLQVTVKRQGVAEGFTMPVPLEIHFGKKTGRTVLLVRNPEETFTVNLPSRPDKVELNPDFSVLAEVKKD